MHAATPSTLHVCLTHLLIPVFFWYPFSIHACKGLPKPTSKPSIKVPFLPCLSSMWNRSTLETPCHPHPHVLHAHNSCHHHPRAPHTHLVTIFSSCLSYSPRTHCPSPYPLSLYILKPIAHASCNHTHCPYMLPPFLSLTFSYPLNPLLIFHVPSHPSPQCEHLTKHRSPSNIQLTRSFPHHSSLSKFNHTRKPVSLSIPSFHTHHMPIFPFIFSISLLFIFIFLIPCTQSHNIRGGFPLCGLV